MLQIFKEFAPLVHVGILDGVKKLNSRCLLNNNKYLNITCLFIFEAIFFKTEYIKKRIALICFIEITSILAHAKTQLNQAVKPYSFNVVKRRGFQFFTMRF